MDEIEKMEAALRAAVAAHRRALRRRIAEETSGFEQRFLFARLGASPAELNMIAASTDAAALPPALRDALHGRLSAEALRLLRLARSRSPRYDLNRHIAIRRAMAWIDASPAPVPGPDDRRSGAVLNARFRHGGSRARLALGIPSGRPGERRDPA